MANPSQVSNAELVKCDLPVRHDLINFASRFETFKTWRHENHQLSDDILLTKPWLTFY